MGSTVGLSFVQYTANGGSGEIFSVPFEYLDKRHIKITVNAELTDNWEWISSGQIQVHDDITAGVVVDIRRVTPRENPMVRYQDGSVSTANQKNLAQTQIFFIVQEALDLAGATLAAKSDGSLGANFRRISDLGTPTEPLDAVNREWAENAMSSQLVQARDARDESRSARDLSKQYRDESQVARDTARDHRDTAYQHLTNMEATLDAAAASAADAAAADAIAGAEAARDLSEQYRNESQTARDTADSHRLAAESSASTANSQRTQAEAARDLAEQYRDAADSHRIAASNSETAAAASASYSEEQANRSWTEANRAEGYADSIEVSRLMPSGAIIMWSGSTTTIPDGYALCDGNNGTPNLTDRFVVAAGSMYSVGATGGSNTKSHSHGDTFSVDGHTLATSRIPSHDHVLRMAKARDASPDSDSHYRAGWSTQTEYRRTSRLPIESEGGGGSHSHGLSGGVSSSSIDVRPLYYALAFIMKL